jgi:hypothetical protein
MRPSHTDYMTSYWLNERAIEHVRRLIDTRHYMLDSDWGTFSREHVMRRRSSKPTLCDALYERTELWKS